MMTEEEFILSLIASDEATGNHLLRTQKDWEALNVDIDQYIMLKDELEMAIKNFKWELDDNSSYREKELLFRYKCFQDYDFNEIANKFSEKV